MPTWTRTLVDQQTIDRMDPETRKAWLKAEAEVKRQQEESREMARSLWDVHYDPETFEIVRKCPTCHRVKC